MEPITPAPEPISPAPDWLDPDWQAESRDWVARRLAGLGRPATGPLTPVRVRPWSVVMRTTTTAGFAWFKATSTGARYEASLVEALATMAPDAVLTALAVDTRRGWLLTADAGPTVRDTLGERPEPGQWAGLLTAYAELQLRLQPYADDLLALGVPDLRPARMPAVLAGLLDDPPVRTGLGAQRLAAVRGLAPAYADWCAELAADGIGASLQHDDLSDGNVFPAGDGYRFFDWGDACVAHPFASLLVALSVVGHRCGLPPRDPALLRLRDAYLRPWAQGHDRARLERSCRLATRVARVGRALAWQRALHGPGLAPEDDHRSAVWEWLGELPAPDVC